MARRVIVIGAGWAGLAAAKTYLEVNPSVDLTILDDDSSVGGVWSKKRLYPGLIADSPVGLFEYSDLTVVSEANPYLKPFAGEMVQDYLQLYAEKHDLIRRIKFGAKVVKAERRTGGGWTLRTAAGEVFDCDKLLVAAGLFSKPSVPNIPQDEDFKGIVMHTKSLGQEHHRFTDPNVQNVVVVGGCKSAVEAACICLAAGKHVHWVVRPNKEGVVIIVQDPDMKPNLVALANVRLFSMFSPSIFSTQGFWYSFLHSKAWILGTWLCSMFWRLMSYAVALPTNYDKSENGKTIKPTTNDFFKLISHVALLPNTNPFVENVHAGENITIHRASLVKLSRDGMILSTGETIPADAVVYATGWASPLDFFSEEEAARLGASIPQSHEDPATEKLWNALTEEADAEVVDALPRLGAYPRATHDKLGMTQFRLYRQILSPAALADGDRSIAFVGFVANGMTHMASELLALWAVAWTEDLLPRAALPAQGEMERDVARVNAWMARRYGGAGRAKPEVTVEIQTFLDLLMADLGLRVERRRSGRCPLLREWATPYKAADYAGVVQEFLHNVRSKK